MARAPEIGWIFGISRSRPDVACKTCDAPRITWRIYRTCVRCLREIAHVVHIEQWQFVPVTPTIDSAVECDSSNVMDDRLKRLNEKAKGLPKAPGVYLMKDDKGRVIYVGKSASLRDRVCTLLPAGDQARVQESPAARSRRRLRSHPDRARSRSAAGREPAHQGHPAEVQRPAAR